MTPKKYFFLLWTGSLVGFFAGLPFARRVIELSGGPVQDLMAPAKLLVLGIVNIIIHTISIYFGLRFSQKLGIQFLLLNNAKNIVHVLVIPSIVAGTLCTILMLITDSLLPADQLNLYYLASNMNPLHGLLGLIPASFNEEITTRLFLLSGVALLVKKTFKSSSNNLPMWVAIVVTALIFGIEHIPQFIQGASISYILIARVILLNGISGTLFGLIFWRYSFEAAMLTHFISDLILYVLIPLTSHIFMPLKNR